MIFPNRRKPNTPIARSFSGNAKQKMIQSFSFRHKTLNTWFYNITKRKQMAMTTTMVRCGRRWRCKGKEIVMKTARHLYETASHQHIDTKKIFGLSK